VIVTGIGKSGHIGRKIAASLASTGTKAFFVHPDLGMITSRDVVLALSWSGETAELRGVVSFTRRFSVPLIALTSGEASALGAMSISCCSCRRPRKLVPMGLRLPPLP